MSSTSFNQEQEIEARRSPRIFIATLPRRILTQTDYETILLNGVRQLIHDFFSRPEQQSPYRSLFRWTIDEGIPTKKKYSVLLRVSEPADPSFT
ncbi:unnamed protein product [Adineta ricciae]|uniref:Uncharacterized protein n=1 Tax=Adineta ricciae TaxID=249248 RepID=A0A815AGR4_ADIRI|nr:unnamed protein product [Adineta ricciae]CAF1255657.1 unnamed protein product [Adineta ricciae]